MHAMGIQELINERILVLDGAMGTMIQQYNLTEADFRGERFKDVPGQMKGNNDLLCLTRPDVIEEIHRKYLEAGADIIETNSFNATSVSMADYHTQAYCREINLAAARLARKVADEYSARTPQKPRFVAGSVGPGFPGVDLRCARGGLCGADGSFAGRWGRCYLDRNHFRYLECESCYSGCRTFHGEGGPESSSDAFGHRFGCSGTYVIGTDT